MYNNNHQSKINFNHILSKLKKRFSPFDMKVEVYRKPLSVVDSIKSSKKDGKNPVISEVKFRSPRGKISDLKSPEDVAKKMIEGGACSISVLTEEEFFGGSLESLRKVKSISTLPVLRKDFIFHPSQIPESYYYGADSILLISSFFSENELKSLIESSRNFRMEPLVEVHSPDDIERATNAGSEVFVINNRNKDTLEIDLKRTADMAPLIKGTKISASGIETTSELRWVLKYADAALIGSLIMESPDISRKVKELVEA